MSTPRAILLPGGVVPADITYGPLLDALAGHANAVRKDLELYAHADPPTDYSLHAEVEGIERSRR